MIAARTSKTTIGVLVMSACLLALAGCDGSLPAAKPDGSMPATKVDGLARVPAVHRVAGSICPSQRGAGMICTGGRDGGVNACATDTDCTAGTNGRCFSPNGPGAPGCSPTSCSYDQCSSDSNCPARVPCLCRASAGDSNANVCVTGGNCAVDSDCGPNGYCSPGGFADFCFTPIYFCHTAVDACTDDTDCAQPSSGYRQSCNYDTTTGHFSCSDTCVAPP